MNTNGLKVTTLITLQLASTNLLAVTTWVTCSYKEEKKEKKQTNNNKNKTLYREVAKNKTLYREVVPG